MEHWLYFILLSKLLKLSTVNEVALSLTIVHVLQKFVCLSMVAVGRC